MLQSVLGGWLGWQETHPSVTFLRLILTETETGAFLGAFRSLLAEEARATGATTGSVSAGSPDR